MPFMGMSMQSVLVVFGWVHILFIYEHTGQRCQKRTFRFLLVVSVTNEFWFRFFVGSPALTSRGLKEADFAKIAEFLDRAVKIALDIQSKTGKKLQDFLAAIPHRTEIIVCCHALFVKKCDKGPVRKEEVHCLISFFSRT
jgi:hypothetical protein